MIIDFTSGEVTVLIYALRAINFVNSTPNTNEIRKKIIEKISVAITQGLTKK